MADRSIVLDLFARDRASAVFKKVGTNASGLRAKLNQTFSPAALTAGFAAGGAAAVAFGVSSVKAFADADAQQRKLSTAFSKFPQLAGANASALRQLNSELQKTTVYDDDATAGAQAILASFGLTEKQLRELTPLLQDYASRTGKDLPTAATDLGKAVLGTGRALKSVGVDFVDTGTKTGNYNQIVAGLRAQVGGFAENEGKTAQGRLEILKNRFGELQEMVGEKLLPTLIAFTEWLNDQGIPALETFFEREARGFQRVKGWIEAALEPFTKEHGILWAFGWWLDKIEDLISAMGKLLGLLDKLNKAKDGAVGAAGDVGRSVGGALDRVLPGHGLIPHFAAGGVMPGPRGVHNLAWVAGGETVLPTHKSGGFGTAPSIGELHVHTKDDPYRIRVAASQALRDATYLLGA